jgi:hypothetical protein
VYLVIVFLLVILYMLLLSSKLKGNLIIAKTLTSPSKKQVNIALSNQSALSGVILVLLWYYRGIVLVISLFLYHF